MAVGWLRSRWIRALALTLGALIAFHYFIVYFVVGLPTTPMTVSRADQLFKQGLQLGQSRADVEAWLASLSIPSGREYPAQRVSYDVLNRSDDVTFKGWWMDGRGNQTVAECAGLHIDDVFSLLRVVYPDANRSIIGHTEITVYIFFDKDGRLLRHWVDEFNFSL